MFAALTSTRTMCPLRRDPLSRLHLRPLATDDVRARAVRCRLQVGHVRIFGAHGAQGAGRHRLRRRQCVRRWQVFGGRIHTINQILYYSHMQAVGCDGRVGASAAILDACGVCGGDGSKCAVAQHTGQQSPAFEWRQSQTYTQCEPTCGMERACMSIGFLSDSKNPVTFAMI
jgi:hypothetical protein